MRKWLMLSIMLCAIPAWATTTVTGTIQNLGTGNITSGAFVRFYLRGCGGNQPRVNGTAIIGPTQGGVYYFDFIANGSGVISGTLYSTRDNAGTGNGDIECGGSKTAVWYGMQVYVGGRGGPEVAVHAKNAATLDVTNVVPITTNPVITSPTGDTTYLRLDAGNAPGTGSLTFKRIESVRYADIFSGSDCGAKVNAADTDLGGVAGEIWVNQACGLTAWTAVTLSAGHTLRFIQGGSYNIGGITLGSGAGIAGQPCEIDVNVAACPVKLFPTAGTSPAITTGNKSIVIDILLDGTNTSGSSVGISLNGTGAMVERTVVQKFLSHGLQLVGQSVGLVRIMQSMFYNNGGDGVFCQNSTDPLIFSSGFISNTSHGFEADGCNGPQIMGNNFANVGSDIYVHRSNGAFLLGTVGMFYNNAFQGGAGHAIQINGTGYHVITSNSFAGTVGCSGSCDAVNLTSTTFNDITANEFSSGGYRYGINDITPTGRNDISDNTLSGSYGSGCWTVTALTNLTNNDCAGGAQGLNRATISTGGDYSTTSTTDVSSGYGTGPITPGRNGEILLSGETTCTDNSSLGVVTVNVYRTTGSTPGAGSAPAGGDVLVVRAAQITIPTSGANLNWNTSFSLFDAGLSITTAYRYYFTVAASSTTTATLRGASALQATEFSQR